MIETTFFSKDNEIFCKFDNCTESKFEILALPRDFLTWQSSTRLKMLEIIKRGHADAIRTQPAHLPVLATMTKGPFFINLTIKGMGLLPKDDKLEKFTDLFNDAIKRYKSGPWQESLMERMDIANMFYGDLDNFNDKLLGGLEIFEGHTPQNLKKYPLASLLYTGDAPKFLSYQFNGFIEFIDKESKYYKFLRAARELFAFDAFHITQIDYPFGYLFYTVEIKSKTPYPRRTN